MAQAERSEQGHGAPAPRDRPGRHPRSINGCPGRRPSGAERPARRRGCAADRPTAPGGQRVVDGSIERIHALVDEIRDSGLDSPAAGRNPSSVCSKVICSIAEQITNLLALNAAIKRRPVPARPDVALRWSLDEVRALASRTQQSTQEIQGMIDRPAAGHQRRGRRHTAVPARPARAPATQANQAGDSAGCRISPADRHHQRDERARSPAPPRNRPR
ncbi:methyl-accepting chemotaxis protein [Pseudomonas aeruginosa]